MPWLRRSTAPVNQLVDLLLQLGTQLYKKLLMLNQVHPIRDECQAIRLECVGVEAVGNTEQANHRLLVNLRL